MTEKNLEEHGDPFFYKLEDMYKDPNIFDDEATAEDLEVELRSKRKIERSRKKNKVKFNKQNEEHNKD